MELELIRDWPKDRCTLGKLYVDGYMDYFTVEDKVREVPGLPVSQWKIKGETAIPKGRYRVIVNRSQRFGKDLPLLLDVPGFTGVRIHSGNTAADTEGCILIGMRRSADGVLESRRAMELLMPQLDLALSNGEVWLTIKDPANA